MKPQTTAAEARQLLHDEAKAIVDKAKAENRGLSPEEDVEFDATIAAIEQHNAAFRSFPASAVPSENEGRDSFDHEPQLVPKGRSVVPYLRSKGLCDERAYKGLSFGRFCRSMVLGAGSDVERRALSEGSDSAGGYTVPTVLMGQLIDRLRAKATVFRAGAVTVPLTTDDTSIAQLATDPVATWRAENAEVNISDPTFSRIRFVPKTLAVIVKASRELLDDSANLDSALMNAFAMSLGLELDRVSLLGSGENEEPEGVRNTDGISLVELDAPLANYSPFVSAWQALANGNSDEPTAAIMAPRTMADLANLYAGTDGQPLQRPSLLESLPFYSTTQVPVEETAETTEVYVGDFRQLYVGVRTALRVEVLKEAFAGNLQYGFLAWLRADVAVAHPSAFAVITGIEPPEETG